MTGADWTGELGVDQGNGLDEGIIIGAAISTVGSREDARLGPAVATTQCGFPVSEDIPGKTGCGSEIPVLSVAEISGNAVFTVDYDAVQRVVVGSRRNGSIRIHDGCLGGVVFGWIEHRFVLILSAGQRHVRNAQSVIDRQAFRYFP